MIKKRVISIIGTRPEFVKIAAISPLLKKSFEHQIINTGQHFDSNMSNNFLKELEIQNPKWNLKVGPKDPVSQITKIMEGCKSIFSSSRPDIVLVFGDTNSTLAGTLTAKKMNVKIAHIEAGMRSFDNNMPEETNRVICDHISNLFFCSSQFAISCLNKEGITNDAHLVGDINYDIFLKIKPNTQILSKLKVEQKKYFLATIHRQENTDDLKRLKKIFSIFEKLHYPVVLPLHPRTEKMLKNIKVKFKNLIIIKPQNFSSILALEKQALTILTDSGGIQKEAYWLKIPCLTLRPSTEWPETLENGWNSLVDINESLIFKAINNIKITKPHPQLYGNGHASEKIVKILSQYLL